MKINFKVLSVLLLIGLCYTQKGLNAQNKTIEGTVVDYNSDVLAYVNIFIQDSFDGSMSGENGSF